MILTILLFLLVLSVLVVAHEFGHFIVAKWAGAKVEEFSVGFPPRIWSYTAKDGMKWTLGAIPIGGFVKIVGENGEDEKEQGNFGSLSIVKRFLVLVAGVTMNVILAGVLFSFGYMIGMPAIIEGGVPENARVRDEAVTITEVLPGSPADGKLEAGDVLVLMHGGVVSSGPATREWLAEIVTYPELTSISFEVLRGNEELTVEIVPAYIEQIDGLGIGAGIATTGKVSYSPFVAIYKGSQTTLEFLWMIIVAFWNLITGIFTGKGVDAELAGPVGIAVMTGQVASLGFVYLLQFAALLSLNLAIINILPFPALDGGRIMFLAYEGLRGKKASPVVEGVLHNIGFILLIILIITVTVKDLVNL